MQVRRRPEAFAIHRFRARLAVMGERGLTDSCNEELVR